MKMNIFQQFYSPALFGVSMVVLALCFPWFFFPYSTARKVNAFSQLILQFVYTFYIKMLFIPIKMNQTSRNPWIFILLPLTMLLTTINLLGLMPYVYTPTTQFAVSLALSFPLWLTIVVPPLWKHMTENVAKYLPPGTPKKLIPFIILIEFVSQLMRPLTLALRISINLTAGHVIMFMLVAAATHLLEDTLIVAGMATALLTVVILLELAIAFIQAYVFVLLLTLYVTESKH